jgi:hypothetical protein
MREKGVFKKVTVMGGEMFFAVDGRAQEILANLSDGDKVFMWVHKARYPEHSRLSWSVVQRIGDAIGQPKELMMQWLKRETGRFDWVRMPDGTTEKAYHSIAFESMDQTEFQAFWNDVLVILTEQVLPKLPDDVFEDIRKMIEGKIK